jgi:protein disulfide-isomerase A6
MFTEVTFGGVNCISFGPLCESHGIMNYQTLILFGQTLKNPLIYDGDKSANDIASFVEENLHIYAKRIPSHLLVLDQARYPKFINSSMCGLILFHITTEGPSKHFVPVMREVAEIFAPEANVSVGSIACEKFSDLCENLRVRDCPSVKLIKNHRSIDFQGARFVRPLVEFVNENCGTDRGIDGLLSDAVGTNAVADALIPEFLSSSDKSQVVEKAKKISGGEFYVKVMERYITNGKESIEKDVKSMQDLLNERKGGMAALDRIKSRFNVFRKFVNVTLPEAPVKEL